MTTLFLTILLKSANTTRTAALPINITSSPLTEPGMTQCFRMSLPLLYWPWVFCDIMKYSECPSPGDHRA